MPLLTKLSRSICGGRSVLFLLKLQSLTYLSPFPPVLCLLLPIIHSDPAEVIGHFLHPPGSGSASSLSASCSHPVIEYVVALSPALHMWPNHLTLCSFIFFTIFTPPISCNSS